MTAAAWWVAWLVGAGLAASPGPPRLPVRVDELIRIPHGPGAPYLATSRLLWVTHVGGFGFPGDVHVIHHSGLAALTVQVSFAGEPVVPREGTVLASRTELAGKIPDAVQVAESKLLREDDVLLSVLRVRALRSGRLVVRATSSVARDPAPGGELTGVETFHGVELHVVLRGAGRRVPEGLLLERELAAGERIEIRYALAFADTLARARTGAGRALADPDPVRTEARRVEGWLQSVAPAFDCPDPWFERAFLYRLLVMRKARIDARKGYLAYPAVAEGRWAAIWYSAAIPFGAGHQLAELRWLKDPGLAWGHLRNFVANQRGDGAFRGARVNELLGEYTDFVAAGAHELFLATGDGRSFAEVGGALARNVDYVLSRDCDGDFLPEPGSHWESGMEWQPSFFAFADYDARHETRLERVEYACYLYANARAAARALELAGQDGSRYREVADRVRDAVEQVLWDASARHYLSLRESDHRPAEDREVVGFYPPGFGITGSERLGYLRELQDPERWAAPWPVPSVEMASPAFAFDRRWPIGPGGSACMWNGPTWPHAQSFVLLSLGRAEREGAVAAGTTFRLLESYTRAHFFGVDERRHLELPMVGEMYDPIHAVWLTNERDYFHSRYVDHVVTLLVGIRPQEGDEVVIDPLLPAGTWDRFALVRVPYHGHELAVVWDAPGGPDAYEDGREGLAVWVDGRLAAERRELGPLRVSLGASRPELTAR